MVSGADVRVALEAGLWEALVGSGDRAAMRSTCRDGRAMADMLHVSAVLPVGADTLERAASIAVYHRQLGAVQALHVRYSASGEGEEAHAVQFMEAYSAALGAALPASHCRISTSAGDQLPTPFAAVLLQRVVPGVERLDMALGSYDNLAQLLQALEPCTRLRALRLLPEPTQHGTATARQHQHSRPFIDLYEQAGVPGALSKLARLHTLSGPWRIIARHGHLQRLCDALPNLTTLGFQELYLPEHLPSACISRQLHTLAAWDDAGARAARIYNISAMATALPAVQRLKGVLISSCGILQAEVFDVRDAVQRFAACAHEWALQVLAGQKALHVAQGLPEGCLAPLQHLELFAHYSSSTAAGVAAMLGCHVSAAPNLATVTLVVVLNGGGLGWAEMVAMVPPLRQAAQLHTLRIETYIAGSFKQQAAALEGVVRCLAQPVAEGEGTHCRALQRVLLSDARPDALVACRRALERDGITVSVGTYPVAK